jgi:ABC-type transport system involved in multi-copper enzyme maturation permease subunit
MLTRVGVIALNTYRESVRARILLGLFALAFGTAGYSLVVGAYTLHNQLRVVSDLGAASISLYAVITAVVLSSTSLYRELELKTIFPVLVRPVSRTEYLLGKFLGTVLTLWVFIASNAGVLLLCLAALSGRPVGLVVGVALGSVAAAIAVGIRWARGRTYLPIPWALGLVALGWWLSQGATDDRRVVLGLGVLTLCEVSVIAAIATVFAAFSSPFLTAVFTLGVFLVGRSADTLARLPARVFGETIKALGLWLSRVVPNLMVYVPPRPVLVGQVPATPWPSYCMMAVVQAIAYSVVLLTLGAWIFRRRDLQ